MTEENIPPDLASRKIAMHLQRSGSCNAVRNPAWDIETLGHLTLELWDNPAAPSPRTLRCVSVAIYPCTAPSPYPVPSPLQWGKLSHDHLAHIPV